jgi:hypothetical protein
MKETPGTVFSPLKKGYASPKKWRFHYILVNRCFLGRDEWHSLIFLGRTLPFSILNRVALSKSFLDT